MIRTILILSLAVACLAGVVPLTKRKVPRLDGRIVGGSATTIDQYPHQLSLRQSGSHICGASIVATTWALCAAHCIVDGSVSQYTVVSGTSYLNSGGTSHAASRIFYHANYDANTSDYDVSAIEVSTAFAIGTTGTATIGLATTAPAAGTVLQVTGWGTLTSGGTSLPNQLQVVSVPTVSTATCTSAYGSGSITDRMLCAGEAGRDSCQGDSGGPLIYGSNQVGIVSWGYGCAESGYPGVYSNVANLNSWIQLALSQ